MPDRKQATRRDDQARALRAELARVDTATAGAVSDVMTALRQCCCHRCM